MTRAEHPPYGAWTITPSHPVGHQHDGSLSNQQLLNHFKAISIGVITALLGMLVYVRASLIARHHLQWRRTFFDSKLAVYKRKEPHPKLNRFARLFWVVIRQTWTNWSEALILVSPIP